MCARQPMEPGSHAQRLADLLAALDEARDYVMVHLAGINGGMPFNPKAPRLTQVGDALAAFNTGAHDESR